MVRLLRREMIEFAMGVIVFVMAVLALCILTMIGLKLHDIYEEKKKK